MANISDRRFGPRLTGRCLALPLYASLIATAPMAAEAQSSFKPHPGGFWKTHPPTNFKGEFGGEDPIGLAYNQHIPTDCSIVWKNGPKFYCFSSQMSSQFVQENPGSYLPQAAAFWAKEHPQKPTDAKADPGTAAAPVSAQAR